LALAASAQAAESSPVIASLSGVFLTEPLDTHGWEWRCYMRDPDGHLIELGQYTQVALDYFKKHAT